MEINNTVKLIQPTIQGVIKDTQYNKDAKCLEHLVEWTSSVDSEVHTRWFLEAQLEIVNE